MGSANCQFEIHYGIAVDSEGNVYVADSGNYRIQKFSWDPGIVGPFPDEIQEKLERFYISENKTQKDIVIEALKHYLKS